MIDFIPLNLYTPIYYNVILMFVLFTTLHTLLYTGFTRQTFVFNRIFAVLLFLFLVLYMGLRPISGYYFGDMGTYAYKFDMMRQFDDEPFHGDVLFFLFMKFMAYLDLKKTFFFIIALMYVSATYLTAKRLFNKYHFFAFIMFVIYFEYWSYGTNGIRNGLAASIVLLAFTFMHKKWIMYILFFIAFNIHSSVLIPIFSYFITFFYRSERLYFKIWFFSILLSLLIGSQIQNFIIGLGIMREDTISTYFQNKDYFASQFSKTGFRWDFLLYSSSGVLVSYYFLIKKKINDPFYSHISNIYLVSNSMWILVINSNFSNRFAYLSWFMLGLVIIYPLLTKIVFKNQFKKVGLIILAFFSFDYLFNFILPNI